MGYIAIGGDAHSDVHALEISLNLMKGFGKFGERVYGIFRGGDDGADPRFPDYDGLGLKQIAKIAREKGLKGAERYAEVLRLLEEGKKQGKESYVDYRKAVDRFARRIVALFDQTGVPVRMFAGNADCFQDYVRALDKVEGAASIFNHGNISYSSEVSLDVFVFDLVPEMKMRPAVVPTTTIKPYEEGMKTERGIAVLKIPYSFSPEVEEALGGVANYHQESPTRERIKASLEKALEQLNRLKPQAVVQIQDEPPVQSLVTMLDPRNRSIEQAEVYQRAIDAITDMGVKEHLIFYGHVGSHHSAQAVPHELADRGIRTFHWSEEGGGLLYLNLGNLEVRERKNTGLQVVFR